MQFKSMDIKASVKATWSFMQWMHSRVQLAFRNRMVNQRLYTLRVSRVGNTQSIAVASRTIA